VEGRARCMSVYKAFVRGACEECERRGARRTEVAGGGEGKMIYWTRAACEQRVQCRHKVCAQYVRRVRATRVQRVEGVSGGREGGQ
jgi:hypothetical protein